jgi:hypothetical protein
VRVNVDVKNFGLRVSRKPSKSTIWKDFSEIVPLPEEVLDVSARKIPEGFRMKGPPKPFSDNENNGDMDTGSRLVSPVRTGSGSGSGSGHLTRSRQKSGGSTGATGAVGGDSAR